MIIKKDAFDIISIKYGYYKYIYFKKNMNYLKQCKKTGVVLYKYRFYTS